MEYIYSMNRIKVTRMEQPEHSGDWHDKPLKWRVDGPANEVQKFQTRKNAEQYATIRRHSADFNEAHRAYVGTI